MENAQITLRESIENAVEQHVPEVVEAEVGEKKPTERVRDESGKFAKAEKVEKQVEVQPEVTQTAAPEVPAVKPRPSSWKKDYEEHWSKLDPALQDYIAQRESDYAKGVSTYKQNFETVQPVYEALQPFMPILQEHNIQPNQWITNLGNAHKMLALGTPEQKLQMFAQLANEYGVNLGALSGQQVDPQFGMIAQELNSVKNELNQFKTLRDQQEQQALQAEIAKFQESAPYFEQVRETMAQLLQSGVVDNLQAAYDKAIRLNDEVWQQQQEAALQAKSQAEAEQKQQKVAEAKAKAVSVKSSSPTGMMNSGNGKKDLRSTVAELVNQNFGERV